jgi:ribosomal-protein-alanine N-acetyltransferase
MTASTLVLTETLLIRPMEQDDLEQVLAIDQMSFSLPWPASAYNYELNENPLSLMWVAEASLPEGAPHIVGMVVVWLVLEEAHIATIAVHPRYRGRGIGQQLVVVALQAAMRSGSKSATLEVRAANHVAQRLYNRFGFQVVGNRPRYYRDNNEDALIMTVNKLDDRYMHWLESGAWKDQAYSRQPIPAKNAG